MKAKDAYALAKSAKEARFVKELSSTISSIYANIKNAAEQGKFSVDYPVYDELFEEVTNILNKDGYMVNKDQNAITYVTCTSGSKPKFEPFEARTMITINWFYTE